MSWTKLGNRALKKSITSSCGKESINIIDMRTYKTEYSIMIKSFTFFVKASNFSNGMMSVQVKDCSYRKRNKSLYFQVHINFYVKSPKNYLYKTLLMLIFTGI